VNGRDFCDRVLEEVGLDLEIVDRETEAALAAIGCTPLMDPLAEGVILFDIGGGSSEIVRLGRNTPASGGPPTPQIRGWASLPLGVVSLAERYGGVRVDRALYEAMAAEVEVYVRRFAAEHLRRDRSWPHAPARHLRHRDHHWGIHLRLKRYDRRQVDGCWMIDGQVTAVLDELREMSYDERVASPCIGPSAPILCWPVAPFWRRSGACFRARACVCRSRPARGHAGGDDARRQCVGRRIWAGVVTASRDERPLKVRLKTKKTARSRRSAGSNAS